MKRILLIATLLISVLMMLIGCSAISGKSQKNSAEEILIKYDGGTLTRAEFNQLVQSLPTEQQEALNMSGQQIKLLNSMAKEEAFYRKAQELGYDKNPEVLALINTNLKPYYISDFYNDRVRTKATVSENEAKSYYDENPDFFTEPATVTIRYIQAKDMESAQDIMNDLVKKALDFKIVSARKSINDYAKGNDGIIRGIRNSGYIQGVGEDAVLDSLIFSLPVDQEQIHGPFETETGIHIFSILNKVDSYVKPYAEVQELATNRVMALNQKRISDALVAKVMDEQKVTIDNEVLNEIDFVDTSNNTDLVLKKVVLKSKTKDFNWTVNDMLTIFNSLERNEKMFIANSDAQDILDHLLAKEVYYFTLKNEGFDTELNKTLKYSRNIKNIILSHTYQQLVASNINVTDEMMQEYYNLNISEFSKPAFRNIEILEFNTMEVAQKAYEKYVLAVNNEDTAKIEKIINDYASNTIDKSVINNVYNNGIVPSYGKDTILNTAIWSLPVNEVSDILNSKRNDKPVIFRVLYEEPISYKPLNHVEPQIEGKLKREQASTLFESLIEQYKEEFNFVIYEDKLRPTLNAKQLFELAERQAKMGKYDDTLLYYDQIIQNFANGKDDYKAMFMRAFTQSEYMNDKQAAIITFTKFLEKYPEGELNADAQVMLDILTGKTSIEIPDDMEFED